MKEGNVFSKRVPDRLTNILKGIGIIIASVFLSFVVWLIIILSGFRGDIQGADHSITAWIVAGIIFLVSFIQALRIMFRPIK